MTDKENEARRHAWVQTGCQGDFDQGWEAGVAWAQAEIAKWLDEGVEENDLLGKSTRDMLEKHFEGWCVDNVINDVVVAIHDDIREGEWNIDSEEE